MSSTNPILGMAVYSLMNALELYQKGDERHHFGAIILMDLSVEYVLKARLYEQNPTAYMEREENLGFNDVINDDRIGFVGDEKKLLIRVHRVRNYAQHRGAIPDSLGTAQYMNWLCKFVKRFSLDNFKFDIELPMNLNRIWITLTRETRKKASDTPFVLNRPIEDNYKTAKKWIRKREQNSKRGFSQNYRNQLLYHLRKFCSFAEKTPDELVEEAENGYSPDDELQKFLKTKSTPSPHWIAINSFFVCNRIKIGVPMPHYKPAYSTSNITTAQIKKICNVADLPNKSWILATSYMGLTVGEIVKLKVADFHIENWTISKQVYPVKIRMEVSNTFDYTTFIGEDAKKLLEIYFNENRFGSQDQPWGHINSTTLGWNFRTYAYNTKLYGRGSQYKFTPKSLIKRLKNTLLASGMRYGWVYYVLGRTFRGEEIDRPLDEELTEAYEKAFPKLKVYDVNEVLNSQKKK